MTLQEAIALVNSDESAEAVVPWRFLPGRSRSAPGSRVDLRCSVCGYRVSLNPTNAERVARGALIFCRNECYPLIVAESLPGKLHEFPDPTVYARRASSPWGDD